MYEGKHRIEPFCCKTGDTRNKNACWNYYYYY